MYTVWPKSREDNPVNVGGGLSNKPPAYSPRFHWKSYRGWKYRVGYRSRGVTQPRYVYHVVIHSEQGTAGGYLVNFSNSDQAAQAAKEWIDQTIKRQDISKLRYRSKVESMANKLTARNDKSHGSPSKTHFNNSLSLPEEK